MVNKIEKEENGLQPFVVYWIKGKKRIWRAAFSTEQQAQNWINKYGDREAVERN